MVIHSLAAHLFLRNFHYLAISGESSEVTDVLSRLLSVAVVSALTRATVGVMGSVRTGMLRVAAVTVRVSAFTFKFEKIKFHKI